MDSDENNEQAINTSSSGRSLGGGAAEPMPASWARPSTQPRVGRIGAWTSSSAPRGGRIGGLDDLASSGPPSGMPGLGGDDDSEGEGDDAQQPQSFFAGGERSGISVEGPARGGGNNLVRDILRKAAQGGPPPAASDRTGRPGLFSGGGHTLGSSDMPSAYVPDPAQQSESSESQGQEETAVRHITFWREGFSVEDGPLLRYDVPENATLLNEINTGHAPPSILNVRVGQPVELRVQRRTNEDYVEPPKRPLGAFEGSGNRLGSPVPSIAGAGVMPSHSADRVEDIPGAFPGDRSTDPQNSTSVGVSRGPSDIPMFEVDHTAPTTSVQIRLADGTRLVSRMNLTHTIGDIRGFINATRLGQSSLAYTIGTTFPNRVLEDDSLTIEAAGLKHSVIVQRLL